MSSMNKVTSILLALTLIIGLAGGAFAQEGPAPAFTLKDLDGKDVQLSSFKGKIVVLDFWATWCPPCREEIPGFVSIQETYGDKGVQVIGVTVDKEADKVKTFVTSQKIGYPILFANKETLEAYGGIQSIPTTFIIDQEQKIVEKHIGFAEKSFFEEKIKALLKPTTAPVEEPKKDVATDTH